MHNIVLLNKFNNYYNRIVKKYDYNDDYIRVVGDGNYAIRTNVNFNIADGISTTLTYNNDENQPWQPDYLLVLDGSDISSRWYVMEASKVRNGQYKLTLRRDVIADNYDNIVDQKMFIEKATLNIDDPMIYNDESMDFNQIKTNETLIKDDSGCAWIVGFLAKDQPIDGSDIYQDANGSDNPLMTSYAGDYIGSSTEYYDKVLTKINDYNYWRYYVNLDLLQEPNKTNSMVVINENSSLESYLTLRLSTYASSYRDRKELYLTFSRSNYGQFKYEYYTIEDYPSSESYPRARIGLKSDVSVSTVANYICNKLNSNLTAYNEAELAMIGRVGNVSTAANAAVFKGQNGYKIKTLEGYNKSTLEKFPAGFYQVEVRSQGTSACSKLDMNSNYDFVAKVDIGNSQDAIFNTYLYNLLYTGTYFNALAGAPQWIGIYRDAQLYFCNFYEYETDHIVLTGSEQPLVDAPYKMFAMPYSDSFKFSNVPYGSSTTTITSNKALNMSLAQTLATELSGSWLYDLQLLPYCPLANSDYLSNGTLNISSLRNGIDYVVSTGGRQVILFPSYSEVKDVVLTSYAISGATSAVEKKINNQTDLYRFCSPAYDSIFDFNLEKNGGITNLNVDFVYKPYNSYIHVNPDFGYLYGADFNDPRGLICAGDFSLPQTTSAWATYTRNNVNYQKAFDREITTLNYQHKIEMANAGVKAAAGAVSTGLAAGAMSGNAYVGAAAGIVSGVAGAADLAHQEGLYKESIDYRKDQFGYQLGNIQAQATTLTKVSAFTPNNKIFPVLEYYTCTPIEKQAFRDKLKYNGMSVGRIGTINEFLQNEKSYIKGKIIRLEGLSDDFHMTTVIADELYKGVFI